MKDGDPQQNNALLSALKEVFPNTKTGACGWHIGMFYTIIIVELLGTLFLTQN